jgi:Flp pilus assembly protein TadD
VTLRNKRVSVFRHASERGNNHSMPLQKIKTSWHSLPFLFVLLGAATSLAAAPDGATSDPDAPAAAAHVRSVEQLAAQAAAAFRKGHFEQSLEHYRSADRIATLAEEHGALRMNIGACLVELGRLPDAKDAFLDAAKADPAVSKKARLNAALVAVELGQIDEAETLLDAASPVDESLSSRARDLRTRIVEKRSIGRRTALLSSINDAAKAIREGRWQASEKALLDAKSRFEVATSEERVDILHGLATTQLALEQPTNAVQTLHAALDINRTDPELHYVLGRAHQALENDALARSAFRQALELGLAEPQAQSARTRLENLDPLVPSEWFGWLSLGGGYDSNPRQSGAATETTLGRRGRGDTAYGRVTAEFGRTQRVHERLNLRLRYAVDWWGLQEETVRDLSIQNHGGYVGAQWAPVDRLVLNFELGPSITYVGLTSIERFMWDVAGSVKARYRASKVRTWRASFDARATMGAAGWEFLSGTRFDADLSHTWDFQPLELRLGLRGRIHSMGTRSTLVDATVISACTNLCEGAEYRIPLSYTGVGPVVWTRLTIAHPLHLAVINQLDWRQYRSESYIVGLDPSRKRRVDLRYSLGVDLQWALDDGEHLMIVPSYALLVSSSNVAQSVSDPEHQYDYDDRRFTQHFIELGLEAAF